MPESYLKGGNKRILYTLKTFMVRQLDFIRQEALQDMKHIKTAPRGLAKLIWLAFSLGLFGASIDILKDLIRGKEIKELDDYVVNALLQYLFFSKYQWNRAKGDGMFSTFLNNFRPPTKFADSMYKALADPEGDDRWTRSVPLGGELYYWWFGGGSE